MIKTIRIKTDELWNNIRNNIKTDDKILTEGPRRKKIIDSNRFLQIEKEEGLKYNVYANEKDYLDIFDNYSDKDISLDLKEYIKKYFDENIKNIVSIDFVEIDGIEEIHNVFYGHEHDILITYK